MNQKESFYKLSVETTLRHLGSQKTGLAEKDAQSRLLKEGPNLIPPKKEEFFLWVFFRQFLSPLIFILILAALISLLLAHPLEATVIFIVILINALIGFIQEEKAKFASKKLFSLLKPSALVLRGGKKKEIAAKNLVRGDVIVLEPGALGPADARLISADGLVINESLLTGESMGVRKGMAKITETVPVADRKNMLFAGTIVEKGSGLAVIIATAQDTEVAKITQSIEDIKPLPTPFEKRVKVLARAVIIAVVFLTVVLIWLGLRRNEDPFTIFFSAVSLAVSAIPEGLPVVITTALAVGVVKMAREKAIVRKISAVETLGTTTLIATDKTGTLTINEMTVTEIITPKNRYRVSGIGFQTRGNFFQDDHNLNSHSLPDDLVDLLKAAVYCNDAQIEPIIGDRTEVALLVAAAKAGLKKQDLEDEYPRLDVLPFDPEIGYMATFHNLRLRKGIFVKGTPEKILNFCRLSKKDKAYFLAEVDKMARLGLRVLAFASKHIEDDSILEPEYVKSNLTFLGLAGMTDPIREESQVALRKAAKAGIRIVILTGDYKSTAQSVALKLGLKIKEDEILEGPQLENLTDLELSRLISKTKIFARITPQDKLKIVKSFQEEGEIVAVTGDGVNDVPALVAAQTGIAMGKTGTDVAKESADLVLADDNFKSILVAVEEGRTIFNNIRRTLFQVLSTNFGEVFTIFLALLLGFPLPLLPLQILWINLATDGVLAIPLALEPKKKGIMSFPPRDPKENILTWEIFWDMILIGVAMAAFSLYLFGAKFYQGIALEQARTVVFMALVLFQIFNAFNSRSLVQSLFSLKFTGNRLLIGAAVLSVILMAAVVYHPYLSSIFQLTPPLLVDWLWFILFGVAMILIFELRKIIRRFSLGKTAWIHL